MISRKGFTLIELVMIIVILGILAAVAIPRYYDLQDEARSSAERGVVGGIRAGLATYYARYRDWPTDLDDCGVAACSTDACFDYVLLHGGITADWDKVAAQTYKGPYGDTSGTCFVYDGGVDGQFTETSPCP